MPAASTSTSGTPRRYDAKMNAEAAEETRVLQEIGFLDRTSVVVDIGAGTGQFALAVAPACRRVVAVDVSPVMLARLAPAAGRRGPPVGRRLQL
jgi:ubiquinone/menaquinone biosynthesis C-methylase UbiE